MAEPSVRARVPATAIYCASFVLLGAVVAALGPSIEELARGVDRKAVDFRVLFTARGLGYLAGVLGGGKVCDATSSHAHRALAVCCISIAVLNGVVPVAPNLPALVVVYSILGLFLGAVDAINNTLLAWLHGPQVAPYMQLLHFTFGVGAFLSPLIVGEALAAAGVDRDGGTFAEHVRRMGAPYWAMSGAAAAVGIASLFVAAPHPDMWASEAVQGLAKELQLAVVDTDSVLSSAGDGAQAPGEATAAAAATTVQAQRGAGVTVADADRQQPRAADAPVAQAQPKTNDAPSTPLSCVIALGFVLFAYVGAEVGTGGWLAQYAILRGLMSERLSAFLTGCFWGSITVGRLAAVFVSHHVNAQNMLLYGMLSAFVPLAGLALAPDTVPMVWGCVALYGLILAPLFPAVLSLPVEKGFILSGISTSLICFLASSGEMLVPYVIGELFTVSTLWMARVCIICALGMLCVYLVALLLFKRHAVTPVVVVEAERVDVA